MPEKKQRSNENAKTGDRSASDSLFDMLNPGQMISNAQKVISSAVNVLEEEIAAGILAAKRIEKKVFDVEDMRSDPENLLNRIRRDTHEALDLFLDAFAALTKQLGILTDSVSQQTQKKPAPQKTTAPENPVYTVKNEQPAESGKKVSLKLFLSDDEISKSIKLDFVKPDLIGSGKQKIAARNIICKPSNLVLPPKEEKELSVLVAIPKSTKSGTYHGLLLIPQLPNVKIILSIQVK